MFLRRHKRSLYHKVTKPFPRGKGYKRIWHYFVWRVKRLPGTPESIAMGLAIGIGVNFWPILFTHLIIGYIFCRLLKGNLIAMFFGSLLGNPGTFAIIWPIMYRLGKALMGFHMMRPVSPDDVMRATEGALNHIWPISSWEKLGMLFHEVFLPLFLGGFLLGLPCVLVTYYVTRNALHVYQDKKRQRLLRRFDEVEAEIETVHPIVTHEENPS